MAGKAAASAAPPQEPETPESDVATDVVTDSDYQPQGASAKLSFIQSSGQSSPPNTDDRRAD